jgi:hypothetical protein
MVSSVMLRSVALVRTDISEERSSSIIRVTRIGELGTLAVTSNRHTRCFSTKLASWSDAFFWYWHGGTEKKHGT